MIFKQISIKESMDHPQFGFVTDGLNLERDFTKEQKKAIEKFLFHIERVYITTSAHDIAYMDKSTESVTIFVDGASFVPY